MLDVVLLADLVSALLASLEKHRFVTAFELTTEFHTRSVGHYLIGGRGYRT
jgi:hypothetical protein